MKFLIGIIPDHWDEIIEEYQGGYGIRVIMHKDVYDDDEWYNLLDKIYSELNDNVEKIYEPYSSFKIIDGTPVSLHIKEFSIFLKNNLN